ncbi:uncharacterized protein LOC115751446 [Rhodamnia argentea]|uniref:Uncharacterized protein LOC115751446 n=1 Tax=Rhodamnia argentea TaxID=178133 RepID=A0A8B8QDM6_9MYRT|nr:uncharacterized protein LOC115751446 [Rhodamnia argentea]
MNDYREGNSTCCSFHPLEVTVGVCPLCLNERLLVLAAKQAHSNNHHHHLHPHSTRSSHGHRAQSQSNNPNRKPPAVGLPKIFALGSFLHRLEFRHWKSDSISYEDASPSPEDSFISIKFEDNGLASWEKNTASKASFDNCKASWTHSTSKKTLATAPATRESTNTKSVIEHVKPRAASLRWRKRIGHLFQLVRWKRSSKGSVCHVGTKVEGVKVRSGWMRTLTKRRTKE